MNDHVDPYDIPIHPTIIDYTKLLPKRVWCDETFYIVKDADGKSRGLMHEVLKLKDTWFVQQRGIAARSGSLSHVPHHWQVMCCGNSLDSEG